MGLGDTKENASPADRILDEARARRTHRHADRSLLWSHSKLPRLRKCGRIRHDATRGVGVSLKNERAHFDNLQSCGSIWACPVCSARIRFQRATEVTKILSAHLASGGGAAFVTLTAPHIRTELLDSTISDVATAWRRVTASRRWLTLSAALSVSGALRTMEVTHGANGWHPHLHIALLLADPATASTLARIEIELFPQWRDAIVRLGRGAPSLRHGIDVRPIMDGDGMAQYLMKVEGAAMELTYADRKKGRGTSRSPMQLLSDIRNDGDVADLAIWHEYEATTKGRRMLTMSRGLKKRYEVEEITDDEIVAQEIGGDRLIVIEGALWSELVRRRSTATVLELLEVHGAQTTQRFLEQLKETSR